MDRYELQGLVRAILQGSANPSMLAGMVEEEMVAAADLAEVVQDCLADMPDAARSCLLQPRRFEHLFGQALNQQQLYDIRLRLVDRSYRDLQRRVQTPLGQRLLDVARAVLAGGQAERVHEMLPGLDLNLCQACVDGRAEAFDECDTLPMVEAVGSPAGQEAWLQFLQANGLDFDLRCLLPIWGQVLPVIEQEWDGEAREVVERVRHQLGLDPPEFGDPAPDLAAPDVARGLIAELVTCQPDLCARLKQLTGLDLGGVLTELCIQDLRRQGEPILQQIARLTEAAIKNNRLQAFVAMYEDPLADALGAEGGKSLEEALRAQVMAGDCSCLLALGDRPVFLRGLWRLDIVPAVLARRQPGNEWEQAVRQIRAEYLEGFAAHRTEGAMLLTAMLRLELSRRGLGEQLLSAAGASPDLARQLVEAFFNDDPSLLQYAGEPDPAVMQAWLRVALDERQQAVLGAIDQGTSQELTRLCVQASWRMLAPHLRQPGTRLLGELVCHTISNPGATSELWRANTHPLRWPTMRDAFVRQDIAAFAEGVQLLLDKHYPTVRERCSPNTRDLPNSRLAMARQLLLEAQQWSDGVSPGPLDPLFRDFLLADGIALSEVVHPTWIRNDPWDPNTRRPTTDRVTLLVSRYLTRTKIVAAVVAVALGIYLVQHTVLAKGLPKVAEPPSEAPVRQFDPQRPELGPELSPVNGAVRMSVDREGRTETVRVSYLARRPVRLGELQALLPGRVASEEPTAAVSSLAPEDAAEFALRLEAFWRRQYPRSFHPGGPLESHHLEVVSAEQVRQFARQGVLPAGAARGESADLWVALCTKALQGGTP